MDEQIGIDMREALAAYAHEAWSKWMKHIFLKGYTVYGGAHAIPAQLKSRWWRQSRTPYQDLPEEEKESDRKEADTILAIIRTARIIKPGWSLPQRKCSDCGAEMIAVAAIVDEGIGLWFECPECLNDGESIDEWPFIIDVVSLDELERAGFERR